MLISSTSKEFDAYYADLAGYAGQGVTHEQATRFAFSKLLDTFAKPAGWTVILEQTLEGSLKRPDVTLYDAFKIPRGYWEAKDTQDDLKSEIQNKIKLKYPLTNTIFEDTRRAVLYQNGQVALDMDIRQPEHLAALLTRFFAHPDEQIEQFPQSKQTEAIQILEQYQSGEVNRVRLACLVLALDDLLELRLYTQQAQQDYRDVLMAAEAVAAGKEYRVNWQSPPADVSVGVSGWLTCPGCGRCFSLSNVRSWNGQRHRSCGQRINPVTVSEPPAV